MKRNNIIITLLASLFVFTACVGDLDVLPLDETIVTGEQAYRDPANYEKALMKLYAIWALSGQYDENSTDIYNVPDAGLSQLLRAWWTIQVASTDECKIAWPDIYATEINQLAWSSNKNDAVEVVYLRCMLNIAFANEFMNHIGNHPDQEKRKLFSAEARFCRAFSYYILLDLFGIPPFITEKNYSINPSQLSRAELFDWIEQELTEIYPDLPPARQGIYGRADQGVVNALLARLYLNAEVYTGTARYDDCITACNAVIAGGYELASEYAHLFLADNGENPDTRKEIIFPVVFQGAATKTTGGMTALILGSRGADEVNPETDGVNEGWAGYRTTQNLVRLFDFADNNNISAETILDKRGIFMSANRSVEIITTPANTFNSEGWAVYKYKNITHEGNPASDQRYPDTDYLLFRLGDVYLMYAEAVARGGQGGSLTTAVNYVNALRERAFGDASRNINREWLSENNFRNLLDERARELYWEGTRRTDLIRFGLFTSSSYLWPCKGGLITGAGVDSRYNVFPIPVSDMAVNGKLNQNERY